MKTNILFIPILVILLSSMSPLLFCRHQIKYRRLYDWSVQFGEVPGNVTAKTFVNDSLHIVHLCVPVVLPELLY